MTMFRRKGGVCVATFSPQEAQVLRQCVAELAALLNDAPDPDDPAVERLFPDVYPEDPEAAAEFRRFTEGALRDGKATGAATVIDTLEEAGLPPELTEDGLMIDVEMDRATAETWLRTFTDLRLALATRLGVEEGDDDEWLAMPDDDPRSQAHDIYQWVGYLQETLVDALTG